MKTARQLPIRFMLATAILLLVVLGTATAAALYKWHLNQEQGKVAGVLAGVADLKRHEITHWLSERLSDAHAVTGNPRLVTLAGRCVDSDETACTEIVESLESVRTAYDYGSVVVAAPDGTSVAVAGDAGLCCEPEAVLVRQTVASGKAGIGELHSTPSGRLTFSVSAPFVANGRVVAVTVMVIDAAKTFFHMVTSWPLPGDVGEAFLLVPHEDDWLVATPLAGDDAPPLTLRIPRDGGQAAVAAMERDGASGLDYRGHDVLAVARPIPLTGWVILVEQEQTAIRAAVGLSAAATAGITVAFVTLLALVALLWGRARLAEYRLQGERERKRMAAQVAWLRKFGNDIVLLIDDQGRILDANDRAEQAYGFARDELLELTLHMLRGAQSDLKVSPLDMKPGQGLMHRSWHRRKDGSEFPVEVSIRALSLDGQTVFQDIVRDITDTVAAEQRIERLMRTYSALSYTNKAVVRATGRQQLIDDVCAAAVEYGGFSIAWVAELSAEAEGGIRIVAAHGDLKGRIHEVRMSLDPSWQAQQGPTEWTLRDGCRQIVDDVAEVEAGPPWRDFLLEIGIRSEAAFPIREDGRVCGALTVFSVAPNVFDADAVRLLTEMTDDLTFGLEGLSRETRRRAAEDALRTGEMRYRALVEDHPGMVCRFLADGTLTFVNQAYCQMFGYSPEKLVGTSFFDLIPADDVGSVKAQVARLGPSNPTTTYVHRAIGSDGTMRWQEWTDRALMDENGAIVEYQSAGRDITDQRMMEQELRDKEQFLAAMTAATRDAIIVIDGSGRITYWNPSAEAILGYPCHEAIGTDVHFLLAAPGAGTEFFQHLPRFRQTGGGPVLGRTLELKARRKDGSVLPVELSVNSFQLNGEWHAVGVLRDVSDRKEMELSLWQAQKMESLGNLAGGIAHDINNMLQPVIGFGTMLLEDVGAESRPSVQIILDAASRIKALVERILSFSRKEELKREVIDLAPATVTALAFVKTTLPSTLEVSEDIGDVGKVLADRNQWQAVLLNLVSNAVDAMVGRVGRLTVTLVRRRASGPACSAAIVPDRDYAVLEIGDTGCGMDEATLARAYDPFFTTKAAGHGTGLGLSIVHTIVARHEGAICAQSAPGKGTKFQIWLPVVD